MSDVLASFRELKGIGPATEAKLHEAGVYTWAASRGQRRGGLEHVADDRCATPAQLEAPVAEPLGEPAERLDPVGTGEIDRRDNMLRAAQERQGMATLGDSHQADATVGEDGTDALDQPPDVDREPSGQLQHDHGPGRRPAKGLVQAGARCRVVSPHPARRRRPSDAGRRSPVARRARRARPSGIAARHTAANGPSPRSGPRAAPRHRTRVARARPRTARRPCAGRSAWRTSPSTEEDA